MEIIGFDHVTLLNKGKFWETNEFTPVFTGFYFRF